MGYSERIVKQTVWRQRQQQQQQLLPCGGQIRADWRSRRRHTSRSPLALCLPHLPLACVYLTLAPSSFSARKTWPQLHPGPRLKQRRRGPFVSGGATGEQLLNVARAIEPNALRGSEETQLLRRKTGPMCEFRFLSNPLV